MGDQMEPIRAADDLKILRGMLAEARTSGMYGDEFESTRSKLVSVDIRTRVDKATGTAWLHVDDVYDTHKGVRGNLEFKTVDEVKRAIRALQGLLPVVDQLGDLADL